LKEFKKIIIVEDEALIADHLAMVLESQGYEIVGIADNANSCFEILDKGEAELAMLDVNLIGDLDGVDIANQINLKYKIPFIFLTSNTDSRTVSRISLTEPYGFIVKPFQENDLKPNIDIAAYNWNKRQSEKQEINKSENDSIFIKVKHEFVKINFEDILYLEACDNYTKVHTSEKRHMLSQTLKSTCENLPESIFFKTHRSFVININKLDSILPKSVMIGDKEVSLSESGRKALLDQIKAW